MVALATARRQRDLDEQAALVAEILAGFRLRALPASVEAALVSLEAGYTRQMPDCASIRPDSTASARAR